MKMIASIKMIRSQEAVISARPYAIKMRELLQHLSSKHDVNQQSPFANRPSNKIAMVVITSDRGMCGAFSSNIIKTVESHIHLNYHMSPESKNLQLICIGKKGADYFERHGYNVIEKYVGVISRLTFVQAQQIVQNILHGYENKEFDKVEIVYNEFQSIVRQRVIVEQFLPVSPAFDRNEEGKRSRFKSLVDYIYEPSCESILSSLVPKHLDFQMWRILLESNAAEQGARMTAMETATANALKTIKELQLSYNKARQASITKELLEIVGGAEALKNTG
jgi:F-type H+-transporting ATPase subunit gamma